MKKFCEVLIVAVVILVVGSHNNHAEARDVYMGTWRSGYDAYLMTETVKSDVVSNAQNHWCTIKAVKGNHVMYIDYRFYWTRINWQFSNSDGVNNVVSSQTPIEKNVLRFISPNARIDY